MSTAANGEPSYDVSSTYSQGRVQGPIIATWILAIIACVLRFTARRMSKAGLWWDDWLILPALIAACAVSYVTAGWMIQKGLTAPISNLEDDAIALFFKGLYIGYICWTISIFFLQYSILALYWRIFNMGKRTRIIVWILLGETFCWGLAVLITPAVGCTSLAGTKCVNQLMIAVGTSIPHVITDGILVLMPIILLWKSEVQRSQKVTLFAIFGAGGLVTIISIARLVTLGKLTGTTLVDLIDDIANGAIWTCVEVNLSLICACLPSLRPIWSFIADKWLQFRNHKGQHLQGNDLIEEMLPRHQRKNVTSSFSDARTPSVLSVEHEELQIPPLLETEANERPLPEFDGTGTAICEVGSREMTAVELENSRKGPTSKLEELPHVMELQAEEIEAAELKDPPRPELPI